LLLIAAFVFTRQKAQMFHNKKHMLSMIISGVAMGTSWLFLYEAYQETGVGIASLAYYCGPVIVMISAPFLFREKLTFAKAAGFLAVIAGMLCVNAQALNGGKTGWGLFCGIMSALMYALMVISNKKAKSSERPNGAGGSSGLSRVTKSS
jgi:drug/metabolite transporter (DMT)-like permease